MDVPIYVGAILVGLRKYRVCWPLHAKRPMSARARQISPLWSDGRSAGRIPSVLLSADAV